MSFSSLVPVPPGELDFGKGTPLGGLQVNARAGSGRKWNDKQGNWSELPMSAGCSVRGPAENLEQNPWEHS